MGSFLLGLCFVLGAVVGCAHDAQALTVGVCSGGDSVVHLPG